MIPSLVVIVPVHDEGANLGPWWRAAEPHLPAASVVRLVYDREDDDTLPVALALAARGAPIELLRNRGSGVLDAIVTGLRSVAHGPVLVSMADLSDDLATVPRMLEEHARGAAIVVASRFMPGGRQIGGPGLKGVLARWGSLALFRLARFPVRDASNSFRLYDAETISRIHVESTGGFEIGLELTVKAWEAGAKVAEVPTTWRARARGESRFKLLRWIPGYGRWWVRALMHGLRTR